MKLCVSSPCPQFSLRLSVLLHQLLRLRSLLLLLLAFHSRCFGSVYSPSMCPCLLCLFLWCVNDFGFAPCVLSRLSFFQVFVAGRSSDSVWNTWRLLSIYNLSWCNPGLYIYFVCSLHTTFITCLCQWALDWLATCLSLYAIIVTDWWPVQGAPCPHHVSAGIGSSPPQPCMDKWYRRWMDGWLMSTDCSIITLWLYHIIYYHTFII